MLKEKVHKTAETVTEFVKEYKLQILTATVVIGVYAACGIALKNKGRAAQEWRKAKGAWELGDMTYDYGVYKIARFIEPNTGEIIKDMPMHYTTVEAFSRVE